MPSLQNHLVNTSIQTVRDLGEGKYVVIERDNEDVENDSSQN